MNKEDGKARFKVRTWVEQGAVERWSGLQSVAGVGAAGMGDCTAHSAQRQLSARLPSSTLLVDQPPTQAWPMPTWEAWVAED